MRNKEMPQPIENISLDVQVFGSKLEWVNKHKTDKYKSYKYLKNTHTSSRLTLAALYLPA